MALLDPQRECVVVRVIYDGPAWAGKTTNLRSLAQTLGSTIYTAEEADGRTLYFDWVDYVGGMFEGMPIRCQIVGVPGQQVFEDRRRLLLETADVVVFVADSSPQRQAENVRAFDFLRQVVAPIKPPVGILAQANKRDVEGPITLDALRNSLECKRALAMTEAVAEVGEGVRETFVLAVRLALDRVRELRSLDALPRLRPGIDDGHQLLSAMLECEKDRPTSLSSGGLGVRDRRSQLGTAAPPVPTTSASRRGQMPPFPKASVPQGFIWPPVEGRIVVHESTRVATRLERLRAGDWLATSDEWKLRSPLEGLFFDQGEARAALVAWAQWHAAAGAHLSGPRCVVLMPEAPSVWRLWQIVRRVPTLRDNGRELLAQSDDVLLGEGLLRIVDLRLRAERELVAAGWLGRLDLASVGVSAEGKPVFAGFSPYPGGSSATAASSDLDQDRLIRRELGPLLRSELRRSPRRIPAMLATLQRLAEANHQHNVAVSIRQILLGS